MYHNHRWILQTGEITLCIFTHKLCSTTATHYFQLFCTRFCDNGVNESIHKNLLIQNIKVIEFHIYSDPFLLWICDHYWSAHESCKGVQHIIFENFISITLCLILSWRIWSLNCVLTIFDFLTEFLWFQSCSEPFCSFEHDVNIFSTITWKFIWTFIVTLRKMFVFKWNADTNENIRHLWSWKQYLLF